MLVRKLRLRRGPAISVEEPQPRAGAAHTVFLLHLASSLHPNPGLLRSYAPAPFPCVPSTQAVGGREVGSGRIL